MCVCIVHTGDKSIAVLFDVFNQANSRCRLIKIVSAENRKTGGKTRSQATSLSLSLSLKGNRVLTGSKLCEYQDPFGSSLAYSV